MLNRLHLFKMPFVVSNTRKTGSASSAPPECREFLLVWRDAAEPFVFENTRKTGSVSSAPPECREFLLVWRDAAEPFALLLSYPIE
jgi:hypothetical protein